MKSLLFMILAIASMVVASPFKASTRTETLRPSETGHSHRPFPSGHFNRTILPRASTPDPVGQLLYIAPTSNTCDGAKYADECATSNAGTVQAIVNGFAKYGVTAAAEQAALLSWMAYESVDFRYNHNHFPGNPGQGLRCMMSPTFVSEYAKSIPELQSKAAAITGTASTDLDAMLALVQPDQYSFAAAAWYYNKHCTDAQKKQIQAGGQNNWQTAFITGCVNTALDDSRVAYWKRACEALGVTVAQ